MEKEEEEDVVKGDVPNNAIFKGSHLYTAFAKQIVIDTKFSITMSFNSVSIQLLLVKGKHKFNIISALFVIL